MATDPDVTAYLAGLLLRGRRVVAVGGGHVNGRRVPKLLDAGADVVVVAPTVTPELAALAASGRLTHQARDFAETDLDGAWYVLAATDDADVNARIARAADERHTFCVRADRADDGSAWTPATAVVDDVVIGVLAHHDPRRSRALRDHLLALLADHPLPGTPS